MDNSNNNDQKTTGYRSVSGLNFRDLVNRTDSARASGNVLENNLYFTDALKPLTPDELDQKITSSVEERVGRLSYIGLALRARIERFTLLNFVMDITNYFATRMRVVVVLLSVFMELLTTQLEVLKKLVIKRMFWGRNSLFSFSVKFFSFFLVVLIVLSGLYRGRSIEAGYQIASAAENIDEKKQYQDYRAVQGSSTQTTKSEVVGRWDAIEYTVKGGDTLSNIAERFELNVQTIVWANSDISDNTLIKPGMILKIPPGIGVLYKVKSGDTLETLSSKYQSTPQSILDANSDKLSPPDFALSPDMEIFLPNGVMPEPPKPKPTIATKPAYSGVVSSGSASTGTPAPLTGGGRWLGWPVSGGGMLTQCYSRWHNGIDIADRSFPSVVSAAPGTVVFSGCQSGSCPTLGSYGVGGWGLAWTVIVDHGNGFSTIYGHLNQLYVSSGQSVAAGTPIGQMGQTGLAYGVHLHFMLVKSGTWTTYNPAAYMTTSICGY